MPEPARGCPSNASPVDLLPQEVQRRVTELEGASLLLVFEAGRRARATLLFQPLRAPALTITVDAVRDPQWGFAEEPGLRVRWHFASAVRTVRLATVRSFGVPPPAGRAVRVEVELAGSALLALEGDGISIGPIPTPVAPSMVS